jgi:hypothetical protein
LKVDDHSPQILEAYSDVANFAVAAPVALCGKVYDPERLRKTNRFKHEHSSRLNLFARTSRGVGIEIIREGILELKSDASPHDADTVDRIHQRISPRRENITSRVTNHRLPLC